MKKLNLPLVSFCIATYKRGSLLKKTIHSILSQTYTNIEIVVADNDVKQSAKKIVNSFNSDKIIYVCQKKNVGMVKNFNTAFDSSHGDYIVFSADDDPFEPKMIEFCMKMRNKFPEAGAYFGAPFFLALDPLTLPAYNLKMGKTSFRNKKIKNKIIRQYSPSEFLPAFLKYEIFDYFLWSCGMVRRNIVKKSQKFKDLHGSSYLTDFAYILRVASNTSVVTMNTEFGSQGIHGKNSGRTNKDLLSLKQAAKGLYEQCEKQSKELGCTGNLEKFIRNWVKEHIYSILRLRRARHEEERKLFFIKLYLNIAYSCPFFRLGALDFCLRIIFPKFAKTYDAYKWIFEKRTAVRVFQKLFLRIT